MDEPGVPRADAGRPLEGAAQLLEARRWHQVRVHLAVGPQKEPVEEPLELERLVAGGVGPGRGSGRVGVREEQLVQCDCHVLQRQFRVLLRVEQPPSGGQEPPFAHAAFYPLRVEFRP